MIGVLAGAASAACAGACLGGTTPGDTDARIAALEAQIAQLRSESASWLTTEQTRALVQEALSDAETRASLLRQGGSAGYRSGEGFYFSNDDGTFDMTIGLRSQFRAIYNDKEGADMGSFGFENTRTQMWFAGHAGSQDLTYRIQANFDGLGGGVFVLEDAWGNYNLGNGWDWGWGQRTAPFLHEEMVSEGSQLAVERSYVNELTTVGRTQGTWVHYANETVDFWVMVNDGMALDIDGTNTEVSNTGFAADGNEWAITSRIEAVLAGMKSQFSDYTSWGGDETGVLLGGAIHWQDNEYGTGATETESFSWTVDASAEFGQANLAAYVVGVHTNPNLTGAPEYDQFGFVVQGGWHIVPDKFEIFGRYEWYDWDNATTDAGGVFAGSNASDDISLFTVGFNYYFLNRGHGWKWTTDLVFASEAIPDSSGQVGVLADPFDHDNQWVLRSQMQVAIP
jgi:hypothetical protein